MPATVLIPPDNRLLGWSLSDLTLYGASTAPGLTIGRAAEDPMPLVDSAIGAASGTGAPAAMQDSDQAAAETTTLFDREEPQSPHPSSVPVSTSPLPPADHAGTSTTDAQPSVAQPIGAGSFIPVPGVSPPQATTADHGGGIDRTAAGPLADAGGVAQSVTTVASALPDSLSHAADTLLTGGPVSLDATGTIDTLVTHLGTAELLPSGADAAALAGGALDPAGLSAFGGTDPAAGLQTLIGMVDSVDAFDLGHLSPTGGEQPGVSSILDSLAADEATASLLGDHADAGHDALDDHGIHLGI